MRNLSFDGEEDSEFAPITDDDAMRKGDSYERFLNISIEPATFESYIYTDNDDDGIYNKSVDAPIKDVYVELYDISNPESPKTMTTNKDGYFKASNLMPGYYYIVAIKDGYTINEKLVELYENNNYYNLSRLKNSSIEGKAFFEDESNTIGNAPILLIYKRMNILGEVDEEFLVTSDETDENGRFAIHNLVPGEYILQIEKDLTYRSYEEITLGENETLYHNVSMELTPVRVFGSTRYNGKGLEEIEIFFKPDEAVENNTAVESSIISEENGFFEVDILPGSYNVEVDEKIGNILVYSFEDYLELQLGEGRRGYNISIIKHSSNISGYTLLNGKKIDNVTKIRFLPDLSIENNSAKYGFTTQSDETGYYSLELSPGYYNVSVEHEFVEDGKNYTYAYSSKFIVDVEPSIYTYDIPVTKEAID